MRFSRLVTFVVVFPIFLLACNSGVSLPTETSIPAFSATPQSSATLARPALPTPTRTTTAAPSLTPSSTPTDTDAWTPYPTATLLVPTPMNETQYRLVDWTPEKAEQLIATLEDYPETLSNYDRGRLDSLYYQAFEYVAFAQQEAALRFPVASKRDIWRWQGAYNALQSFSGDVGSLYGALLVDALNNGATSLMNLKPWFEERDPRLTLEITSLMPLLDYQDSQIALVKPKESVCGGWAVWLVKIDSYYNAYSLKTGSTICYGEGEISIVLQDLTGDKVPEVIIRIVDWQSFGLHNGSSAIYQVSQIPPRRLQLDPEPYGIEIAYWDALENNGNATGVALQIPIGTDSMTACGQFGPIWNYHWNGDRFKLFQISPPPVDEMKNDPRCADIMTASLVSGNQFSLKAFNDLIAQYPRSGDYNFTMGDPWPTQGELRLQMGLNLAVQGNVAGAREQMQAILSLSVITPTYLNEAASSFLENYHAPDDLLSICLAFLNCQDTLSVSEMVSLIPPSRFDEISDILARMGVSISYVGMHDFDNEGVAEYWLLDCAPGTQFCSFWLFTLINDRFESKTETWIEVNSNYNSPLQIEIVPLQSDGDIYPYRININGVTVYQSYYWNGSDAGTPLTGPEWIEYLIQIQNSLLSEEILPETAILQLRETKNLPLPCHYSEGLSECIDDGHFRYLLGLAYELSGDSELAAQTYLDLWRSFPNSPFAIMAMAKLEPVR